MKGKGSYMESVLDICDFEKLLQGESPDTDILSIVHEDQNLLDVDKRVGVLMKQFPEGLLHAMCYTAPCISLEDVRSAEYALTQQENIFNNVEQKLNDWRKLAYQFVPKSTKYKHGDVQNAYAGHFQTLKDRSAAIRNGPTSKCDISNMFV